MFLCKHNRNQKIASSKELFVVVMINGSTAWLDDFLNLKRGCYE